MLRLKKILICLCLLFEICSSCSKGQSVVIADFGKFKGNRSALMFGGNNYGFSTKEISDMHRKAGFNAARYDALINEIVPPSSIADYKINKNNIQDSRLWRWERIDHDLDMLNSSGFKTLLIINYCPVWLAYDQQRNKNNINSVPADWYVYEDIVKKVFEHVQARVYAVEVWNEPDLGFSIEGSVYKDKISAYLDLYYHTANAVRSVNKSIKIGGPAAGNTYDFSFLYALLNDSRIKSNFDFYSYHFYGVQKRGNISLIKRIAASRGKPGFPVFISEWNYSAEFNKDPMNTNSPKAISFIGNTLVNQYIEGPDLSILYCMDDYKKADNFYTMDSDNKMVPKVDAIKLMSVKLGLGEGMSKLYSANASSSDINVMCSINSHKKKIVCIVNQDNSDKVINIYLRHAGFAGKRTAELYEASSFTTVDKPTRISIDFNSGNAEIHSIKLPANSVEGLIIN